MHEQPRAVADTLLDRLHPDGTLVARRGAHHRRRVPGHRQGVHRGLRQQLPRRPWWPSTPSSTGPASRPRSTSPASSATATRSSTRAPWSSGSASPARRSTPSRPSREARRLGAKVLVISNVVDSSMAREADGVLYTRAGPEVGVASTKTPPGPDRGPRDPGPVPGPGPGDAGARRRPGAVRRHGRPARQGGDGPASGRADVEAVAVAVPRPPATSSSSAATSATRWPWKGRSS